MSNVNVTGSFDFYETLRYVLPGLLLIFLLEHVSFPGYWDKFSFPEKLAFGILFGFIIQSFGLYKWVPGSIKIIKKYNEEIKKLTCIDNLYIRGDIIALTVDVRGWKYFKRYFALGAFKLDIVFMLIIFTAYYILSNLMSMIYNNLLEIKSIITILSLLVVIYVVRDDGLNDLRRAFNILLILVLKYKCSGELDKNIQLFKKREDSFIKKERAFFDPIYFIKQIFKTNQGKKGNQKQHTR